MTLMAAFKTMVLGGYGNFGARICRALVSDEATRHHMAVLVAGLMQGLLRVDYGV